MAKSKGVDWQSRIGRRLRLRDLHILFAVVETGSMAKAGARLRVTQSAVSRAIGDLEAAIGVRLLDRSPRGVEPTVYGEALLKCGVAAFDELRGGISHIEHLADPEVGEVRIASTEAIAAGLLPAAIERFSARHPKVKLHLSHTTTHAEGYAALRDRTADVVLTLGASERVQRDLTEDLQAEVLLHERICLVAAAESTWARRRKLSFEDLSNATFIAPPAGTAGAIALEEAFRGAGLPVPHITLTTFSVHARSVLSSTADRFIAVLPSTVLWFNPGLYPLKLLPLELPTPPWPIIIVMRKGRTLRPAVAGFIACVREISSAVAGAVDPR
jgi:DNA-binding transcriptional LysR family regulator